MEKNRSIVAFESEMVGHPKGSRIGAASDLTGYGVEYAAQDLVSFRVQLDAGQEETFYFTQDGVDEMNAKFIEIRRVREERRQAEGMFLRAPKRRRKKKR